MKVAHGIPVILTLLAWGVLPAQTAPATTPATVASAMAPELLALEVKGEMRGLDTPIDLSWNGTSSRFSVRAMLDNPSDPKNKIRLSFRGTISLQDGGAYLVKYSLSYQIAIPTQLGADGAPIKLTGAVFGVTNSIQVQPGQPVTLVNDQGKKVILTFTRSAGSSPTAPAG